MKIKQIEDSTQFPNIFKLKPENTSKMNNT